MAGEEVALMYLTGNRVKGTEALLNAGSLGLMNTPKNAYLIKEGWVWAADNGCFGKGYPGDEKWLRWLESFTQERRATCLFATAPDVVGDGERSMDRSLPWLGVVRDVGYAVALVTQDGMDPHHIPWDLVDWLFIGGSDQHKLGDEGKALIEAAQHNGKRVHVGRVNSQRRFLAMAALGVDSVDGTFLGFGPDQNLPRLLSWQRHLDTQLTFETVTGDPK